MLEIYLDTGHGEYTSIKDRFFFVLDKSMGIKYPVYRGYITNTDSRFFYNDVLVKVDHADCTHSQFGVTPFGLFPFGTGSCESGIDIIPVKLYPGSEFPSNRQWSSVNWGNYVMLGSIGTKYYSPIGTRKWFHIMFDNSTQHMWNAETLSCINLIHAATAIEI